jgi:hypothetical protein
VITAEDGHFYQHHGLDWPEIKIVRGRRGRERLHANSAARCKYPLWFGASTDVPDGVAIESNALHMIELAIKGRRVFA